MRKKIEVEFMAIIREDVETFMKQLLEREPEWTKESISEDESGDVWRELVDEFARWLKEER